MLQITTKLTDSNVAKKIAFVNTFEGSQEIADIGPHPFNGVAMYLVKPTAVVVASILFGTMTEGGSSGSKCSSPFITPRNNRITCCGVKCRC